ncbi:DoxX family protein [Natranaeroarchaeum aerophilus]|uniref:DoxX family protein n=1 Tax=Natranaeroarchaeum aerophilus TaxID=2917711 RepID=A0AAE3FNX9_9EURY|nr:DoxX family protein [Natranaeroarchaeum aerophilus]MCL9812962.1 DoxX family protein [Natranaeroarchaeum aerophilus]
MISFASRRLWVLLASIVASLALWLSLAGSANAHEEYVVDQEQDVTVVEFLGDALSDPFVVGPLVAGAIGVLAVVVAYLYVQPVQQDIGAFRAAMVEYTEYVPWLLRISFGIPLIGAGFSGYFITPALEIELRILQVALGFLLLFGFATRVVALVTLVVYVVGAVLYPIMLLQLEMVGGLATLALVGSGKPSADHVFQRLAGTPGTMYGRLDVVHDLVQQGQTWIQPYERFFPTVARVGLGVTFIYLGVSQKILRPGIALEVVDHYDLTGVIPVAPELWVLGAGLTETALGVALILGLFTRASAATAITMFALTLFALPDDPVLAHVALFGMASVLLIGGSGPLALDNRIETITSAVRQDREDVSDTAV